ncbi:MAG: HEAT repeat domain-containing protein [Acidobacteriota bacterium]
MMRPMLEGINSIEFKSTETLPALKLSNHNGLKLRYFRQIKLEDKDLVVLEKHIKSPRSSQIAVRDSIQASVLGSRTLDDVWTNLTNNADQQSYLLLKAWIQLHPRDLPTLFDRLKGLGADDAKLRAVIKALTAVGSDEAQHVMVQLLESSKHDPATAQRVVSSLGFVQHPSHEAEGALVGLVRSPEYPELGRRAELALGIMGGKLKNMDQSDKARSAALEKNALARLSASKDSRQAVISLGMLGNLGPTDRQNLAIYLQSEDPELRAQAYFALRSSPQQDTPQFLADAYFSDPSMNVKKQIFQALILRIPDETWYLAVDRILTNTIDEEDQFLLAQTLVKNSRNYREKSLRLLGRMLQKGGSDRLKSTLAQYHDLAEKGTSVF